MSALIKAENVSLDVPIYLQRERENKSWAGMLVGAAFNPPRRKLTRLLDNINFEIREGDRLAILGRNGAGKSTLLRVLNQVYQPTAGNLTVRGSCQALLNMSLGFNGEATVGENIYLRGVAMGVSASFLREQVPQILEFSALSSKVNHRLRTLSSGQKMRLGFAISTSVQHDIMLMDEWVGAGDANFMSRAKERMRSRVGGSKIVVLASHSVGLLRDMCNKGIVLEQGRLVYSGDIMGALKHYHNMMARIRDHGEENMIEPMGQTGQLIYGCAEKLELREGKLTLQGWMTSNDGREPTGMALDISGVRYRPVSMTRSYRGDVARHFGLGEQKCGFTAVFELEQFEVLGQLGSDLRVLGGDDMDTPDTPLRVAAAVTQVISGN